MIEVTFTRKEADVLNSLIRQLYAEPGFSDVDAGDIAADTGMELKAVGGVLSALQKKGVIDIEELSPRTGHLGLGENGEGVTIIYLNECKYHARWAEEEGIEFVPVKARPDLPLPGAKRTPSARRAPMFSEMDPIELATYLEGVGDAHGENGSTATMDDYYAAAGCIRMLANEQEKLERIRDNLRRLIG